MQEERARKRYQNELPKIHEKMLKYLIEYEEIYGEPFIWDNENLLEIIKIQQNEFEKNILNKTKNLNKTVIKNKNQRPPFQIQNYMI